MRFWPRSLGMRLGLAFAVAVGLVLLLATFAEWFDPPPPAARRPIAGETAGRPEGNEPARVIDLESLTAVPPPADGLRLQPVTGTIALASRLASLPPDVRPVVEVFDDGAVALRRSVPVAQRPDQVPTPSGDGHGAGVVLGGVPLTELGPDARRALVRVLAALVRERPIAARRLRPIDFGVRAGELDRLLRWIP